MIRWLMFVMAITLSVIEAKHVVGAYQVVNAFCFAFNCYGKILPTMGQVALWTSLVSFFVILVAVPAKAATHQDAKFVFATFVNNTGWESNGIGASFSLFPIYPFSFSCYLKTRYYYTQREGKRGETLVNTRGSIHRRSHQR